MRLMEGMTKYGPSSSNGQKKKKKSQQGLLFHISSACWPLSTLLHLNDSHHSSIKRPFSSLLLGLQFLYVCPLSYSALPLFYGHLLPPFFPSAPLPRSGSSFGILLDRSVFVALFPATSVTLPLLWLFMTSPVSQGCTLTFL